MNAELAVLAACAAEHPIDVASLLERGRPEEIAHVLGLLERETAGRVLARMTPSAAAEGLTLLDVDAAAESWPRLVSRARRWCSRAARSRRGAPPCRR